MPEAEILNRKIVLQSRPAGIPGPENFLINTEPVRKLAEGEVLLKNLVFAIDPAVRGMLDDRVSYLPSVPIGGLVPTMVLGRVIQSRNPAFREGDFGRGFVGWEEYSILNPANIAMEKLNIDPAVPLTAYMGALGWSGITAYIGLHRIGAMQTGETVVVSAAAGAVGSVAVQVAKLCGNRVVGIAGGREKTEIIAGFGIDTAIDYRQADDLGAMIKAACPKGADIYFDNVGGRMLDTMLPLMADNGRIVACGMVSDYNHADEPYPIRNLWQMVVHRITMRGFLAYEHLDMLEQAQSELAAWIKAGKLKAIENVTTGLEHTPRAFIRLMSGKTIGKTIVRLDDSVTTLSAD